jgi:stage II sporulation protein GA (sporulation sigma-E factor processing peptidase)
MKVYIEFIYIINFLLDFMILYGTKRLLKINKSIIRIIISSLFGMMSTLLLYINISNLELFIIKIFFSITMIIIAFGFNNIIKNTFYFYLISIILGGMIYLFNFKVSFYTNYILLMVVSPIIIYLVVKELINHKLIINDKYDVSIIYNKKVYRLEGFIDTGNKLESPISKKSVILVNLKISSNKLIYIPYKALNTSGVIPCIKPDKIIVNDKIISNCLVGLSHDKFELNGCNCILPNRIKEDLC